jgi:hypothetical protein
MNWKTPTQFLLSLTQTVTTDRGHSLVCIPDRSTAEYELEKLRTEYGKRLIRATIRKDRPSKRSTYTVRYFTRDTETVRLF